MAAAFGKTNDTEVYHPHLHEQGWLVLPALDDAIPALENKVDVAAFMSAMPAARVFGS